MILLLMLQIPYAGIAQQKTAHPDSIPALMNAIALYRDRIYTNSAIYEGREYVPNTDLLIGHPYFEANQWAKGDLHYKEKFYPQVDLLYDLINDEVVLMHHGGSLKIKLFKDELSQFSLAGHTFIKIASTEGKPAPIPAGFYDQLYKGDLQLLVKRTKVISEPVANTKNPSEIIQQNTFYIVKDGAYHKVAKKAQALKVLKDQKKELRQLLRRENINFRKNPELALTRMVEYYDQANSTK